MLARLLIVAAGGVAMIAAGPPADADDPAAREFARLGTADGWMEACGWQQPDGRSFGDAVLDAMKRMHRDDIILRFFKASREAARDDYRHEWGPFCVAVRDATDKETVTLRSRGINPDGPPLPSLNAILRARQIGRGIASARACLTLDAQVSALFRRATAANFGAPWPAANLLQGEMFAGQNDVINNFEQQRPRCSEVAATVQATGELITSQERAVRGP